MSPLFSRSPQGRAAVAAEIEAACRNYGFFYLIGHGIAPEAFAKLEAASHRFFALGEKQKLEIAMAKAGRAWRGYFPLGGELTSGKPDEKEGLYFGVHLPASDPRVLARTPIHGANLYPAQVPELRGAVEDYMAQATRAAHALMEGLALSLGLDEQYFRRAYTADPTVLFRIFRYPPPERDSAGWGVGEHTDYGLLTLLSQDQVPGLQVKTPSGWIEAPPVPGTLVCNIGDMLDKLTGGWFRSTPHRVKNISGRERFSFPLFFDPAFHAKMEPLPERTGGDDSRERWDKANVHAFQGTYGEYLLSKVSKVFPELGERALWGL
jgi:isopenicillin N synthase-like dioxygenase